MRRSIVVVVTGAVCALLLAACGSSKAPTSTTTTAKKVAIVDCPLTGTPAPGNVVPRRAPIAMKVDNYSLGPAPAEARPQSGLDYADIIFEEQVEGAITRYAAVYQCHNAPGLVGPIRSARWTDIQMLSELGHPILVHVGGILPVLALINSSALVNLDLGMNGSLESNPVGRYAPYDTYTSTQAVWAHEKQLTTSPSPLFTYSTKVPNGPTVNQVHLDWSGTSDIYWRWDVATGTWLRFYNVGSPSLPSIKPDILSDGAQNQAQNVIVQDVNITYGPWVENSGGGLEAESHIIGNSGKAYVFRNGTMITGTWVSSSASSPTKYLDSAGKVIALEPGRTWVEIYPAGASQVVTPQVATTSTTTTAAG
ncbi:MAG TPA: DUF3048 domain-containing protein [Acidimicrobiales bacterium]|nr:DUF3048 domain-containing protein [Acidimicrobiales bacterium]